MNQGGFLYIGPLYDLVFNVLVVLYRLAGENLGIALILIAVLSRLILVPLTRKQLKNVDKNKEFQKKYEEVKKKYKNNKEAQTRELAKLQSQYLPGQLSGCLTLILQLLLLIQINYVIRNLLRYGADAFNEVAYSFVDKFNTGYQFNLNFINGYISLAKSASNVGVTNFKESWAYLLIALFLVSTQYFSMKIFSGMNPKNPEPEKEKKEKQKKTGKGGKKGEEEMPSFSEVFQDTNKQMMMFFPLILGFFSLNYPSGLSLYFATTSLFVIIQQAVLKRKELIAKLQGRKIEEKGEENRKEKGKENLNQKKEQGDKNKKRREDKKKRNKKRKRDRKNN